MFSDDLLTIIFSDERICKLPLEYQSVFVNVMQDVMQKRYYTDYFESSKEEILDDICGC